MDEAAAALMLNVDEPQIPIVVAESGNAEMAQLPSRATRSGIGLFTSSAGRISIASAIVVLATRQIITNAITFFMSTSSNWLVFLVHPSDYMQSHLRLHRLYTMQAKEYSNYK